MLQLLDFLLPQGYTLPVFPEMDELTVGGLINGYGIESSSHKYGLFHEICVALELVLPNAKKIRVTNQEKLFHTIPMSFGTVSFLTAVELRVIPASKYVRQKYIPVYSREEAVSTWKTLQTSENPPEFLEGIMYSEHLGIIMTGELTDTVYLSDTINNINLWFKPYFYKHALGFVERSRQPMEELIPLRQYYQRHNRSIFWALEDQVGSVCHNAIFRALLGWLLPPRVPFLKLIESEAITRFYEESYVMQDWLVPLEAMDQVIATCEQYLSVYPLWLCPFRVIHHAQYQGKIRNPEGTTQEGQYADYIDIATIGQPKVVGFNSARDIGLLEKLLRKLHGYQGNYSYTYQTREEYREMFDHTLYDSVREELGASIAFPESYEKVSRKNQWKPRESL